MDVKLQNAYVEVLLDNFLSVVKQNVMFQAQLKTFNDSNEEVIKVKNALEELSKKYLECEKKLTEAYNINNALSVDNTNKENQIVNVGNLQSEKDRLQVAVNDYMKQLKIVTGEKDTLENELNIKNKYIEQLETIAPITKLKKIRSTDEPVSSGGTF